MNSENDEKSSPELKPAIRILTWFTICYSFSLLGYIGTSPDIWYWYQTLRLPVWGPPIVLVIPITTLLYGLCAWASWEIWNGVLEYERKVPIIFFFCTLGLNALWPWLFYWRHLLLPSMIGILALAVLAGRTIILFWRLNEKSGMRMLPYAVWLVYQTAVVIAIWWMNR